MKVAHLTTADISLWYLLRPQLRAVIRIGGTAIGISAPGRHVADLESAGIQHAALHHSTRRRSLKEDINAIRELRGILRRIRPDVLHTHNPKPGLYGRIVGRLTGVPVVLNTTHGLYASPNDSLLVKAVVYSLEAIASRFSDYELVQNVEDYELLTRWRITRPNRTILLGNGIDVRHFDPDRFGASERAAIREELGIGADAFVTGIVARLVRGKGFVELTEAAERLDDRHVIIAVGPNDRDKSDALDVQELARARAAGISFVGHRDDVDRLYAVMNAFVLPSHREGFPRAAMEAAAMGLPVVASNIRGCRQVVDDGVTGFLFPLGDAASIADALAYLAEHSSVRRDMGAAARRKALSEFDERAVVEMVLRTQVFALREKGKFERLKSTSDAGFTVRWATERDIRILAAICGSRPENIGRNRIAVAWARRRRTAALRRRIDTVAVAEDSFGPVGFALRPDARRFPEPRQRFLAKPVRKLWRFLASGNDSQPEVPGRLRPDDTPGFKAYVATPFRGMALEELLRVWVQEN